MTYTLDYHSRAGLWMLQVLPVGHLRTRFYVTRDEAMKTVTRYLRMLNSEQARNWNTLTPNQKVAEFERYDR